MYNKTTSYVSMIHHVNICPVPVVQYEGEVCCGFANLVGTATHMLLIVLISHVTVLYDIQYSYVGKYSIIMQRINVM